MCRSQLVTYACNSGGPFLRWRVQDAKGDMITNGQTTYAEGDSVGQTSSRSIGDQFTAILTSNTDPLMSTITFTAKLNISNYTVQCGPGTPAVNCTIVIVGIIAVLLCNFT